MPALEDFKGTESGRVFLLASGPSLNRIPPELVERLGQEKTFIISSVLRWPGLSFIPTYYMGQEIQFWAYWDELLNQMGGSTVRFHADRFAPSVPPPWVLCKMGTRDMQDGWFFGLDDRLNDLAGRTGSATLLAAQVAVHMGFRELYLLGCDATNTGYAFDPTAQRIPGDTAQFILCSEIAHRLLEPHGVRLTDLTEGGNLTIPKGDLREVLS